MFGSPLKRKNLKEPSALRFMQFHSHVRMCLPPALKSRTPLQKATGSVGTFAKALNGSASAHSTCERIINLKFGWSTFQLQHCANMLTTSSKNYLCHLAPLFLQLRPVLCDRNALDEWHLSKSWRLGAEDVARAEEVHLFEDSDVGWQALLNLLHDPKEEVPGPVPGFLGFHSHFCPVSQRQRYSFITQQKVLTKKYRRVGARESDSFRFFLLHLYSKANTKQKSSLIPVPDLVKRYTVLYTQITHLHCR